MSTISRKLQKMVGYKYERIDKGMYLLPQSGKLAHDQLVGRLKIAGYFLVQLNKRLWRHVWRPILFILVVDDFGVKSAGKEHANHLYDSLDQWYDVTTDWKGEKYVGISLKWDYEKHTLMTSLP